MRKLDPEPTSKGVITDKHELHKRINEAVGTRRAIADDAAQDREFERQERIERELLEKLLAENALSGKARHEAVRWLEIRQISEERKRDW